MVAIMIVMTISYIISGFYDILVKNKLPKEKGKLFEGSVHKNKVAEILEMTVWELPYVTAVLPSPSWR